MILFLYQHEKAETRVEKMAGDRVQRPSGPQIFPSHYLKLNTSHALETLSIKDHFWLIEGHQSLIQLSIVKTKIFSLY